MSPEGYLQELTRDLSKGRASRDPVPGLSCDDPARLREELEGRDLDEVLPSLPDLAAAVHGRALREATERLGLGAEARWGCGGLPLETLDILALEVPFGGGVALALPSGLVKFIAALARIVARLAPDGVQDLARTVVPGNGGAVVPTPPGPWPMGREAAIDQEFADLLASAATPQARIQATVPARSDPATALAILLGNVAERFALACSLAGAVLEPPRVPLWSRFTLGPDVEARRLLLAPGELMASDVVATRLAAEVDWHPHPGFTVWGIDLYLGGLAMVESLAGRPRKAEHGFLPAANRRNLVRTLLRQAAGVGSEQTFECSDGSILPIEQVFLLADEGADVLAGLWDRNRSLIEARLSRD